MVDNDEDADGPLAGERLAEARRAADIPLRDIAKDLHLDEVKVRALEENRFSDLGAAVFAKGHLRKYAELVGIAPDDIILEYYKTTGTSEPPLVVNAKPPPTEPVKGRWVVAVIVLVLVIAAGAWMYTKLQQDDDAAVVASPPPPTETAPVSVETDESPQIAAGPATDQSEVVEMQAEPSGSGTVDVIENPVSTEPATTAVAEPAADVRMVALSMSFSADCWTEVTDASGNRLFFDLARGGSTVEFSGAAPLRVLLGDSYAVSLQVDGVDYSISDASRRGNSAIFSIN